MPGFLFRQNDSFGGGRNLIAHKAAHPSVDHVKPIRVAKAAHNIAALKRSGVILFYAPFDAG